MVFMRSWEHKGEVLNFNHLAFKENSVVKKLMTLMLGLTMILGTTAAFAQDKPATKTEKKSKKKASKKKAADTEKKS